MLQIRQVLSYGALFLSLLVFLFYGVADSLRKHPQIKESTFWDFPHESKGKTDGKANYIIPDFSQYVPLITLSSREFPLDDTSKRILVIGDIHGEIKPFRKLLRTLNYSPGAQDVLIHVGDIVSKGPLEGSLAVLEFMASNNVTGVRGNHDQKVIEWRGWLKWISTIPRASQWLNNLENQWREIQANEGDDVTLQSWLRRARKSASHKDKPCWQLVPNDWLLFDDHYSIARDMSELQYQYLLKLPLRLYVPSAHAFIVHAGLLPYNPHYPVDDTSKQPLARLPDLPPRKNAESFLRIMDNNILDIPNDLSSSTTRPSHKYDRKIEQLRNLQEIALLTEIPQNTDPWVTLNIRSIANGKVKRRSSKGKPWSKIWEEHMQSCVGYDKHETTNEALSFYEDNSNQESEEYDRHGLKRLNLLCYPSTTIYGHSAARGLNAKRWSFGLDSGCIYNKKLTALVIGGKETKRKMGTSVKATSESDEFLKNDDSAILKDKYNIPFGDHSFAKVVSVKC